MSVTESWTPLPSSREQTITLSNGSEVSPVHTTLANLTRLGEVDFVRVMEWVALERESRAAVQVQREAELAEAAVEIRKTAEANAASREARLKSHPWERAT